MSAYLPHHPGRRYGHGALAAQAPAFEPAHARLVWTEYAYLAALAVALLVVVDPLGAGLAADTVVKHLALLAAVPAVALTLLGRGAVHARAAARPIGAPLGVAWPLAALALFIVAGSLYARLGLDIRNTFLNVGLYVAMMFCAAAMVLQSDDPGALARAYLRLLLAGALVMSALLVASYGKRQVYHEQIFLVIPMAALAFVAARRALARWAGALFFLAMAWFSHKYTSYLIGVLALTYLGALVWLPRVLRAPGPGAVASAYWGVVAAIAAVGALAALALRGELELPSGNPEYRLQTYWAAWDRFADSPWWGTGFAVESVEKFTGFTIGIAGNVLPTHSDVLDIAAHGGLAAVLLWALGLWRVGALAHRALLRPAQLDHPWAAQAHTLALLSLAAVLTYAFNPILLQPSMAALVWTNLGMLLGLALCAGGPAPRLAGGRE
ncbi:MAG: hypothetical protein A3G83_09995 [Betaproteobacteria bacterium RIFCSPLOWO2_12_FULL_68_20]|nr:MAG: hypothetical protein A3G83_09995 [Betaproteobacteria bacterium RIFCSPLOWO2_12_FULL_68_20]